MKLNKLRNNNAIQKERKKLKKYVNKTAILSKEISTISYYPLWKKNLFCIFISSSTSG
jgi:hypothetical protein